MKNYKLFLISGLFVCGIFINSTTWATISLRYEFAEPRIEKINEYHRVIMSEVSSYGNPGKPVLPIKTVRVLLPMGEEIASVDVKVYNKTELFGSYKIEPGQLSVPISKMQAYKNTKHKMLPDSTIYNSANPFPEMLYAQGSSHRLCGYEIAHLYLYPVEYLPEIGKLSYYKSIEINITTKHKTKAIHELPLRQTESIQKRVRSLVDNPDMISTYPFMFRSLKTDSFDYLIITNEEFVPLFDELRKFKTNRGVKTEIAKVESIYAYCSGADEQEKIRNFIINMYTTYGITYVLLGGDDEIIPNRGLYDILYEKYPGYEYEEYDIASDLYYGGLDGNWNQNGNDKWGEPNEADLYAEVFVGRACVDSDYEAINFIQKTINYQETPKINNCTTAIMVGEDLHWNVWGGEYKEEVKNGSSNWGHTTAGFPAHFQVDTLYDRSLDPEHWDKNDLIPMLNANNGTHLVNHLGHADILMVMKMGTSDVRTRFTNTSHFIVHSQGCYSTAFDNRDCLGSYCPEDAIAECFTTIPNGAVCFIGNTRYGWGNNMNTNGTSQRIDREFFDALFNENIYPIGEALQDAKEDVIPYIDSMETLRWCYYNLVLLGDPELQVWTDTPKSLTVTHSDTLIINASSLPVNVKENGNPVNGALVCAYQDSTIYARSYTNASGDVTLSITPVNVGSLYVQVTAHNFLPHKSSTSIISNSSNVIYYKSTIDDDAIGFSNGNNNRLANPGEQIELPLWVQNFGLIEARRVYGKITSTDPYVTIQADSANFGNILPTDTSLSSDDYAFTIAIGAPDEHIIDFKLTCKDSLDSLWISYPNIKIYAPVLKYNSYTINDSVCAIPNEALDPDEEVKLIINLKNEGSIDATGIEAIIHTEDTFITVIDSIATFTNIPKDSISNNFASPYIIQAKSTTPIHHLINFSIRVTADGYEDTLHFVLRVGLGGDFLVWDPDKNHSSGSLLADALWENNYIGDYTQDLSEYRDCLPKYKTIFVCLGMFFTNYVLTPNSDVDSLHSYLEQGGNLYMEGGNAWYRDTTLTLQEHFHIDPKSDGTNEIDTVTGITSTFTNSMQFNHFGENKSIDRINGGNGAWDIFANRPVPYTYGVAFRSGKYNTIGTSFEFGTLKDGIAPSTRVILADSIMKWFLKPIQHDITIWSIDNISSEVLPEIPINPLVTVKNIGKFTESFSVICNIDSLGVIVYVDTFSVSNLLPDSSLQFEFAEWTPRGVVEYKVSVITDLSDDELANNERNIETLSFICTPEITSYYIQTTPIMDGKIDTTSEWAGVVPIDISDVFNKSGFGASPPYSIYLYVMNDDSTIYFGIDAQCDSRDNLNGFTSFFDDNHSHRYPYSPDSSEGAIKLIYTMATDYIFYHPMMRDMTVEDYEVSITGVSSNEIGWLQYEIAIPLGTENEYINTSPGDSFGMHLVVGKYNDLKEMENCYGWWPQTVDEMGNPSEIGTIILGTTSSEEIIDKLPTVFTLSQSMPNPMREKTLIKYALPRDSEVELKMYNIGGQLIRTLVNKHEKAGYKAVYWDGKDNQEKKVASGIYFYHLKIDNSSSVKIKKIAIIR